MAKSSAVPIFVISVAVSLIGVYMWSQSLWACISVVGVLMALAALARTVVNGIAESAGRQTQWFAEAADRLIQPNADQSKVDVVAQRLDLVHRDLDAILERIDLLNSAVEFALSNTIPNFDSGLKAYRYAGLWKRQSGRAIERNQQPREGGEKWTTCPSCGSRVRLSGGIDTSCHICGKKIE